MRLKLVNDKNETVKTCKSFVIYKRDFKLYLKNVNFVNESLCTVKFPLKFSNIK